MVIGTIPLAKPPASDIEPIVEDYSDLAAEEDDDWLQDKVAGFKVMARFLNGLPPATWVADLTNCFS